MAELEKSEGFAAALAATRNMVTTAAPAPLTTQEARKIIKQYCWWINETLLFKKLLCRFRQVYESWFSKFIFRFYILLILPWKLKKVGIVQSMVKF